MLAAVGLSWADVQPARSWPPNEDERRAARRATREVGWAAALNVLALESRVILVAAREFAKYRLQTDADDVRLALAVHRVEYAANALIEPTIWKPGAAS